MGFVSVACTHPLLDTRKGGIVTINISITVMIITTTIANAFAGL